MNISLSIKKSASKPYFEVIDPRLKVFMWMEEIWHDISYKTIFEISLPGTHDSGSYSCDFNNGVAPFAPKIIKRKCLPKFIKKNALSWTKTQQENLFVQLMGGARYLDLRVCVSVKDNEIRTEHSIYGDKYSELLSIISLFVKTQKKEFLILDMRHFSKNNYYEMTDEDHEKFTKMIYNKLGQFCVRKNEINLTLEELLEKNHRVFIIYHIDKFANKYDWLINGNYIWNKWTNTHNPDELSSKLTAFVKDFNMNCKERYKLFCLQSCITPDYKMIKQSIYKTLFGKFSKKYENIPSSLKDVADEANTTLVKWLEKNNNQLNIVCFDSLTMYRNLVVMLIHLNK